MGGVDVEEVIDALYALTPAQFTAARDEAAAGAKRAGDPAAAKRIAALRRPTRAAWTSNLLVRANPEEAGQFCQLGEALREAHRSLDGEQLRELSHEQHVVIGALAREAVRLAAEAGTPVSETVVREVEQILRAVLADPDAAEAWTSGRLVKPPAAVTEFPALAPDAARPAPPPPAPEPGPGHRAAEAVAAARAAAREAEEAAQTREEELRTAEEAHARAAEEAERADAARDRAHEAETTAAERVHTAARTAEEARRRADTAARHLHALTDGPIPEDP
ncbi:hypothetical protein Sxan_09800 [Streptomyces xanthophaeus]|uniref:Uncharacterized protein n=1 Tax=Streptomyces xanthophaeus TaxID=67385 RepID=A0A919LBI2_9ACTN|nr:hypothetical protein Sxan_09800 [Streptomyces xanthophaeus]